MLPRIQLLLIAVSLCASPLRADQWTLQLRLQQETPPASGSYQRISREETWPAEETAVVVCDVWDYHHCLNAMRRLEEFAPRLNQVLAEARRRGATIIHSPSDCMAAYADHPARKRAVLVPPAARMPADIHAWCSRIPSEEQAVYPIDQSDGGEDDNPREHAEWAAKLKSLGRNPGTPWKAQSPLIAIDEHRDYVSDRGDEVWSILEHRQIKHVILAGVHTNMCVLGRPFGLRQMAKNGKRVVLMRDLTDSMYNPQRWPHVDHFTGHDLVVSHVERHVCPTITSNQLSGGQPFRWKADTRLNVDVASVASSKPQDRAAFEQDWSLIAVPSSWKAATGGVLDAYEGPAWYRCVVCIPKDWPASTGATLQAAVPRQDCQAWLNGKRLSSESSSRTVLNLHSQAIEPDDANLLVLRIEHRRGESGLCEPPVLLAASSRTVLKGRWQFRLGNDERWSNWPLPAKFAASTDIVFEVHSR